MCEIPINVAHMVINEHGNIFTDLITLLRDNLRQLGCSVSCSTNALDRNKLNIHQFNTPQLEEVRISYLLNNRCFVFSETADSNPYGAGVAFHDYDELVERGIEYLQPAIDGERARVCELGYAAIKGVPMVQRMGTALSDIDVKPAGATG